MGTITVKGLRLTAHHGVMEQERKVGNTFEVNISIEVPASNKAMESDQLNDTINYALIVDIVKREMAKPSKLIEHVAGRIKNAIVDSFGNKVASGSIEVRKLAPPIPAEIDYVSYICRW